MDKEKAKSELILPNLKSGEELIGFFYAVQSPSKLWQFLIGSLAALRTKVYFVAVTTYGLHLHRPSVFGRPARHDFFEWSTVSSLKLGNGLLQALLKITFVNGSKLALKAQLKGFERVATLDDTTKGFLLSKTF